MNDEKYRQIQEDQREQELVYIALSIFQGSWPYNKFLANNPTPEGKKYIDDWLRAHLALPKYKGKIIPGFNDK